MARKKISEFKAKKILYDFMEVPYNGISIDTNDDFFKDLLSALEDGKKYVLKVDQGIKQRKKKGLISFGVTKENVIEEIEKLKTCRDAAHLKIEKLLETLTEKAEAIPAEFIQ